MNTHSVERTSPKGGPFIGRCVYCGKEGLSMKAALEACPSAPSQDQQVLDAIESAKVKLPGKCSARPPLVQDVRKINPMAICTFKPKHKGPHSWEVQP